MHLVSRADLHAVIPYGHPRIRTRKDPRLSLSPDSSAELKAAMPRPSEGAAAPSEQSGTGSPFFSSAPSQSPDGGGAIGGRHLMKKAPTVTGYGVSRGIGLSVGSGSPLSFGNMLCKTKAKRKWEEHNTRKQVGKENTEALPMGATEEPGRYRHALSDPFLTCFRHPPLTFTVGSCQALFIVLY